MASSFIKKLLLSTKSTPAPTFGKQIIATSSGNFVYSILRSLYLKYWKVAPESQRLRMLLTACLSLASLYIITPTITSYFHSEEYNEKMFSSKRKDKYTTGLINTRNDCFANSSIQAFASLPGLDIYLNDIMKQHKLMTSLPIKKESGESFPQLPLHEALAVIVKQLQEPIASAKCISVWPFLQVIEKIFNSRISTNQNDAHELVQLILETLDNEFTKLKKFVKSHNLNFVVPELPFNGLLADQLTCLACLNSSKPSFHPFSVLSLPAPSQSSSSLDEMMKNNEVETINGYNCLRCKIKAILKVESQKELNGTSNSEQFASYINKLKEVESELSINDDLDKDLEAFIKNYDNGGFKVDDLKSTIVKKTLVIKAPEIFTIHLSRSLFTSNQIIRNGCRVKFEQLLSIEVDEVLANAYLEKQRTAKKLKKKSKTRGLNNKEEENENEDDDDDNNADDDDIEVENELDGYDENRNEPEVLAKIHSKVLTQHDEEPEFVEDNHQKIVDESSTLNNNSTDAMESQPNDSLDPYEDEDDANDDDIEEDDTADAESISTVESDELNASKQNVKYKLYAVIRHQGTHNAGHYECYRRKPILVKDTVTDQIVNVSPVITFGIDEIDEEQQSSASDYSNDELSPGDLTRRRPSRLGRLSGAPSHHSSVPPSPKLNNAESSSRDSFLDNDDSTNEDEGSHFSRFKSRIGSMVSRRSSVSNGTALSRRASIVSKLPQPTEDVDNKLENLTLYENDKNPNKKNKRYKKISSVVKYPFWRISDTQITEVHDYDVLRETQAVYMIYYQRVK